MSNLTGAAALARRTRHPAHRAPVAAVAAEAAGGARRTAQGIAAASKADVSGGSWVCGGVGFSHFPLKYWF